MNASIDEQQLQTMLNGVDIPPCPAVLIELDAELKKDDPDQRELTRIITKDVALSGHVMQIANSPAFSGAIESHGRKGIVGIAERGAGTKCDCLQY